MSILGLVVETPNMVPVIRIVVQFAVSPALVYQRPGHDARVVYIPFDGFRPLLVEAAGHFSAKVVGTRHLAPDEETQAIRPVVEHRRFDLLMFTAAIEAHRFAQLDVFF